MLLATLQLLSGFDLEPIARESVVLDAQIVKDPKALEKFLRTVVADAKGADIMTKVAERSSVIYTSLSGQQFLAQV